MKSNKSVKAMMVDSYVFASDDTVDIKSKDGSIYMRSFDCSLGLNHCRWWDLFVNLGHHIGVVSLDSNGNIQAASKG